MLKSIVFTCCSFLFHSAIAMGQYTEFYTHPQMEDVQDPSFEYPFSQRPNQERLYVTQNIPGQLETITRSWIGTAEEEAVLGRKLLQINGDGGLAIWFPMGPTVSEPFGYPTSSVTLGHYVTVRAKSVSSGGAVFGINYFDSSFTFIKQELMPINGSASGTSRGNGDLLKKYTLPVRVPTNARFGQVWIANVSEASREAQDPSIGGALAFDFLNVFTESRDSDNDSGNPSANQLRNGGFYFAGSSLDFQVTGYEFWNVVPGSEPGVEADYFGANSLTTLNLGQRSRITNVYQVMGLTPNQTYDVLVSGLRTTVPTAPAARAWFGIDYFNVNGSKIGNSVYNISQEPFISDTITPPTGTDFAIAWFYVEPLFADEVFNFGTVAVRKSTAAAKVVKQASIKSTNSKTGPKAPASPITKAIALQAREAIQSNASKAGEPTILNPPAKKPTSKKPAAKTPGTK